MIELIVHSLPKKSLPVGFLMYLLQSMNNVDLKSKKLQICSNG